jgi:hypothetical protein
MTERPRISTQALGYALYAWANKRAPTARAWGASVYLHASADCSARGSLFAQI